SAGVHASRRTTGARRALSRAEAATLRGAPEPRPDLTDDFAAVDDLFAGMEDLELGTQPPLASAAVPDRPSPEARAPVAAGPDLGDMSRPARLVRDLGTVDWSSLDPRAGFLVTQADGRTTFDELVIISGLPEADARGLLLTLVSRGILA
ncbi:MAG: hypothetical protein KC613_17480, partial [Myxococcales bacterium]|nr:hypothetical protein [Myxococcales bacterium]